MENKNKFRNLKSITNNEIVPDITGNLQIEIEFKKPLNSLKSLFENITELKEIDLSNLNMSEVTNMDSMFSGCSLLENINFSGIDTRNLKTMNYIFKDCKKVKQVDLSSINSQNLENMTSMFSGCENISLINISSFPKVEDDILNGINTKVNIISNERISNKLNKISLNSLNTNINIVIIIINNDYCQKGQKEKCKECSSIFKGFCSSCNEGYFLPIDSINQNICSSCNKNPHCKKCLGTSFFILCQECEEGYILENNKCNAISSKETDEPLEEECITGIEEKCLSCQTEKGKKKQCFECNEGFYLPTDSKDKYKCETCKKINNCISCNGTLNSPICNKCEIGYKLISNKCIEITCDKGPKEKCYLCNTEPSKKEECLLCNDGYFIPDKSE